ncbi:MAG: hypothetical protein NXI10_14835 [bacterium]|nr:hypothetical protein [bacterium]
MDFSILTWALIGAAIGAVVALILQQRKKNADNAASTTDSDAYVETAPPTDSAPTNPSEVSNVYTVNMYKEYQTTGTGVGVAFSGGGSRSLSCTLGQLRGLKHLGKLEEVAAISAVSGGSWASSLYTYLPNHIDDDNFLGAPVGDPGELTLDYHGEVATALDRFSPHNMGQAAVNLGVIEMATRAVELYLEGVPADDLWVRVIGEYVFAPFDLFNTTRPKYFTESLDWFNTKIQPNNTELTINDFYVPKQGRPELIVNFNIAPEEGSDQLFPMESTQKMAGILPSFPKSNLNVTDLGGGYIDPFGFGSKNQSTPSGNTIRVVKPENRFSVHTASGLSSAAFAETLLQATKWPSEVQSIVPKKYYWPVMNPAQPSQQYEFADGGNLEDTAITALLRRKFGSIIAFVNGSTPISWDDKNEEVVVSEQIAVLFGYQPKTKTGILDEDYLPWERFPENYKPGDPLQKSSYATFAYDRVFDPNLFLEFTQNLYDIYIQGGTTMWKMENVKVMDQPHLGVEAYTLGKILWVVNTDVKDFTDKLEGLIQDDIALGDAGQFAHFPYYETIGQLHLSKRQVNLLAHLSCWNIISQNVAGNQGGVNNQQMFLSMFD